MKRIGPISGRTGCWTRIVLATVMAMVVTVAPMPTPTAQAGSGIIEVFPEHLVFDVPVEVGQQGDWIPIAFTHDYDGQMGVSYSGAVEVTDQGVHDCEVWFTCQLNVRFTPTARGEQPGVISIVDWDTGEELATIDTSGIGVVHELTASPVSHDFGVVAVGATSGARTVTFTTTGGLPINLTGLSTSGPYNVTRDGCMPQTYMQADRWCSVDVTFAPTAAGTAAGSVTLTTEETDPVTVPLTGTGLDAALSLDPTSVDFGDVAIGQTSLERTITVSNSSGGDVPLSSIQASGPFTAHLGSCGASLPASQSCQLSVTFSPSALGAASGTLSVGSGQGALPASLSGTGVYGALGLDPSSLSFGVVEVDTTSPAQRVTVSNPNPMSVSLSSIRALGGFFVDSTNCGDSLAANLSCEVSVRFAPNTAGPHSDQLYVNSSAGQATAALDGMSAQYIADVSPETSRVGTVEVGATVSVTIQLTNRSFSTHDMVIEQITTSSDVTFDTATSTCASGRTLGLGAQCDIVVTVAPSAAGSIDEWVRVDGGVFGLITASITGTAIAPSFEFDPDPIEFENVLVDTASAPMTVTLSNVGSSPVETAPIETSGPFSVDPGDCGAQLEASSSCELTVTFEPTAPGTASGSLSVGSGVSVRSTALSGFGETRSATLSPNPIGFGDVTIGTEQPRNVTVRNTGNVPMDVTDASAPAGVTADTSECATLSPDRTCSISLRFEPTMAGPFSGTLTVATSFGDLTAALTGRGLPLLVEPDGVDLGAVTIGHDRSESVSITNLAPDPVAVAISSPDGAFEAQHDCPDPLPAGTSCTATVTFAPDVTGAAQSSFLVATPADGSLQSFDVGVAGVGVIAAVSAEPLDFGMVRVGSSDSAPLLVTNTGAAPVEMTALNAGAPFEIVDPGSCLVELMPSTSCSVEVTFSPTEPGQSTDAVKISYRGGQTMVDVTGFGVSIGLSLDPGTHDFGALLPGTPSAVVPIVITNTGNVDASLAAATVEGPFEVTSDGCAATTLVSRASCEIGVRYIPGATDDGAATGRLVVTGTGDGAPLAIATDLRGYAAVVDLDVDPPEADFGTVAFGGPTEPRVVTATNSGNIAVLLDVAEIDHPMLALATVACAGVLLEPGASCALTADYVPTEAGDHHATTMITGQAELADGTHDVETSIALAGKAAAAALHLETDGLDFGDTPLLTASAPRTIRIVNDGPTVTLGAIDAPQNFEIVDDDCSGVTLASDEPCEVTIVFSPTEAGSADGELTVAIDADVEALSAPVTGFATTGDISISPTSIDVGEVVVGQRSSERTVRLRNESNTDRTIGDVTLGLPEHAQLAAFGSRRAPTGSAIVTDAELAVSVGFEIVADRCNAVVLAPGDDCEVVLAYAPRVPGRVAVALRIDVDGQLRSIALHGTATTAAPDVPTPVVPGVPTPGVPGFPALPITR